MARKTLKIVADICLYGTSRTGAGYLALKLKHGLTTGTGEVEAGFVRIFAPGGERMAVVDITGLVPCFGDLKWEAAPVHTLSVEAVLAAAQ